MADAQPAPGNGTKPLRTSLIGRLLTAPAVLRCAPAWLRSHLWLSMAGAVGVLAAGIGTFLVLALVFPARSASRGSATEALELLRAGKLAAARQMAAELRGNKEISYVERGAVLFILGTAVASDAEVHRNPREQQMLFLVASRYLEESRLCGFPPGHEAAGLLHLSKCLVRAGRSGDAIPILKQAVAANPQHQRELYELLMRASLEVVPPQPKQALDYNRRYLAAEGLSAEDRQLGLLHQAEIYLALGDPDAGRQTLAQIPPDSAAHAPSVLLLVRLLLSEADQLAKSQTPDATMQAELRDALTSAIASLEELVQTPRLDSDVKTRAQLLQAICYQRLEEPGKAIGLLVRIRRASFGSPEAFAAAIFEADLHLAGGRPDEALKLYTRAIGDANPLAVERNTWLPRSELEAHLSSAFRRFVETADFSRAVELARALPPLLDESLSYQWRAQAQHAWAEHLLTQAAPHPLAAGDALRSEARSHFRQAAADFERLAELRIRTRNYLDDLSRSAADYLAGQGYSRAVRVYRLFLRSDPQEGRAEALTGLGEALLAVGDTASALAALNQCRDIFPKHPVSYRARYLASLAQQEQGKLDEAQKLLIDNLYNFSLTPDSAEWRDSLFAMGKLRYREGTEAETRSRAAGIDSTSPDAKEAAMAELQRSHAAFQEAIRLLDEAIRRYPKAEQAILARYLLAESHRQASKWPRKRLDLVTIEASKAPLVRQMQQELEAAVEDYIALIEQLGNDREGKGQSPLQQAILRNSYFGRADALFDMGRYDEAAEAYSAATNRYQNEPESLSAYVQIAACYRRQDRLIEARGTLEQARLVLQRIRQDADFTRTTPYSREGWNDLLTWLSAL